MYEIAKFVHSTTGNIMLNCPQIIFNLTKDEIVVRADFRHNMDAFIYFWYAEMIIGVLAKAMIIVRAGNIHARFVQTPGLPEYPYA